VRADIVFHWSVYLFLCVLIHLAMMDQVRNLGLGGKTCLDSPARKADLHKPAGLYPCHNQGGNQVRTFIHRWQQSQQQSILQVTVLVFSLPLTSKCGSSSTDAFVTDIDLTFKSLCWMGCHNGNTLDSYSGGTQFESQWGHGLPSGPQGRSPIRPVEIYKTTLHMDCK
jgi:hypothetical protein